VEKGLIDSDGLEEMDEDKIERMLEEEE